jgi:hypothetical protein
MADHLIESKFPQEFLDRSNRRTRRMATRFSLKSRDADAKEGYFRGLDYSLIKSYVPRGNN